MNDEVPIAEAERTSDPHRRRAAHLYGLIVSGAVLATASDDVRLARVSLLVFLTLLIYWAAETYVHWIAARSIVGRDLTRAERGQLIRDGWPLVSACGVPVLFLAVEALLGVETPLALDLALTLNAGLLFLVGWQMGRASGLTGVRQAMSAAGAGLLGVALIVLKTLTH